MVTKKIFSFGLLVFVPISIVAEKLEWNSLLIFLCSAIAIIPLALWLSIATEELALITGPNIGGLINAIFGNATELIISLVALKSGLIDIVKASITGSLLANLLLVMGLAMFIGGLRYKEQTFNQLTTRINGSTMSLAVTAIVLPATVFKTSNIISSDAISQLSLIVASVLIIVYGLTLIFSLKTHSYLYEVGVAEKEDGKGAEAHAVEEEKENPWLWAFILLVVTLVIAFESEIFVGAIEETTSDLGLTALFTGVILVPLIGGAAEYVTAVRLAIKNNMDLAVSITIGSTLLVALLVAPVLVIVGQLIGQPMDLNFNLLEVVAVFLAVAFVNLISLDGRSNWLEGILLLATYIILGASFFFHP